MKELLLAQAVFASVGDVASSLLEGIGKGVTQLSSRSFEAFLDMENSDRAVDKFYEVERDQDEHLCTASVDLKLPSRNAHRSRPMYSNILQ